MAEKPFTIKIKVAFINFQICKICQIFDSIQNGLADKVAHADTEEIGVTLDKFFFKDIEIRKLWD